MCHRKPVLQFEDMEIEICLPDKNCNKYILSSYIMGSVGSSVFVA